MGFQKTEKQISRFELEYKITSDVFLKEFAAENMKNGDREYIEWTGELKIRDRIAEDLKRLREIEYVTQ
jgi:hypothetical protein